MYAVSQHERKKKNLSLVILTNENTKESAQILGLLS